MFDCSLFFVVGGSTLQLCVLCCPLRSPRATPEQRAGGIYDRRFISLSSRLYSGVYFVISEATHAQTTMQTET